MAKEKKTNTAENADISKSKAKREERRKEVARERRQKRTTKIITITVVAVLAAIILFAAGKSVFLAVIRTTSAENPSVGLTADGKIENVNVKDIVTLADYANISVPEEEVAAKTEEVEDSIKSTLEQHKEPSTDASIAIADGDEVNIDFVGTVDGVEFEGGNSNGEGYDLTIGSGSFVDDFEQQLIGHKPGEEVTVEVTFPADYDGEDVAGKDASFAVTINSINITPELTDEFVAENITEEGVTTAAEYRAFVENNFYEQHLKEFLTNYILENSTVKSYPSQYLKTMRALLKYNDEQMLASYEQMSAYYGFSMYENLWDLRDDNVSDELSYELELRERAKEEAKDAMVYQALFEDAGLTIDMEAVYAEMTEQYGEESVTQMKETNGEGYIIQNEMREAVIEHLTALYKK
ncbi:trigger factor [Lachnospiraceae bacterium]|nr:trigger factor [Lachnospiraceae bacterium]